jgi:predicted transcriptional regulator of viral defense system
MSKLRKLSEKTISARKAGRYGLFTTSDLALLLNEPKSSNFSKFLHKAAKAKVLTRVCKDIYLNPLMPPDSKGVLENIALLLHWDKFLYISLESQLSYLGIISQVLINHLTIMTTGRSRKVETIYGVIEFTHTNHSVDSLSEHVYFDPDIGIFRAKKDKAIRDLNRVGRNVQMLEE